jgi:GTP-binding protein Era
MNESTPASFRSGFVALVGRPNVGKSTLLNALVGEKISIVTPRPQTTRHRVLGLSNGPDYQIAFVDTPGLHHGGKRALNKAMNRTAAAALLDADIVVWVVEALRLTDEDTMVLERVRASGLPAIAVINKVDKAKPRDKLLPFVADLSKRHEFLEIVPVSATQGDNVAKLLQVIAARLPVAPQMYPLEQRTDRGLEFQIAETIREKLTMELVEEVPYGIAVQVERIAEQDGQQVVDAVVWVDRAGQKPIVIGAGGERLKRIGRAARLELNERTGQRFHLQLWVKVRDDWADNAEALRSLGME